MNNISFENLIIAIKIIIIMIFSLHLLKIYLVHLRPWYSIIQINAIYSIFLYNFDGLVNQQIPSL